MSRLWQARAGTIDSRADHNASEIRSPDRTSVPTASPTRGTTGTAEAAVGYPGVEALRSVGQQINAFGATTAEHLSDQSTSDATTTVA